MSTDRIWKMTEARPDAYGKWKQEVIGGMTVLSFEDWVFYTDWQDEVINGKTVLGLDDWIGEKDNP